MTMTTMRNRILITTTIAMMLQWPPLATLVLTPPNSSPPSSVLMVHGFSIPVNVMHFHDAAIAATAVINTNLIIPHSHAAVQPTATAATAVTTAGATAFHNIQHVTNPQDLLNGYKQLLKTYPLPTKMVTGATLAVTGDAIAQQKSIAASRHATTADKAREEGGGVEAEDGPSYDRRRALSFAVFDMAYRALQHFSFPIIVAACHGQFIGSLSPGIESLVDESQRAAMEQTLASQLGIVPFLYYPAFFALTGAIQGLDWDGAIARARTNFVPLMKRNLLFWIPVQYIQFSSIPAELQIPFLSVCGLAWTFILSVAAGSAKANNSSSNINNNSNNNNTGGIMSDDDSSDQDTLVVIDTNFQQQEHQDGDEVFHVVTAGASATVLKTRPTYQHEQLAAVAGAVVVQDADEEQRHEGSINSISMQETRSVDAAEKRSVDATVAA